MPQHLDVSTVMVLGMAGDQIAMYAWLTTQAPDGLFAGELTPQLAVWSEDEVTRCAQPNLGPHMVNYLTDAEGAVRVVVTPVEGVVPGSAEPKRLLEVMYDGANQSDGERVYVGIAPGSQPAEFTRPSDLPLAEPINAE